MKKLILAAIMTQIGFICFKMVKKSFLKPAPSTGGKLALSKQEPPKKKKADVDSTNVTEFNFFFMF